MHNSPTHQHFNVSFESGHPILHLNSLTSRCSVLRNMDYGCLFHWIMGSAQIRDNLKMSGGRLFRVVLPPRGELHLCCSFESRKHQWNQIKTSCEKKKLSVLLSLWHFFVHQCFLILCQNIRKLNRWNVWPWTVYDNLFCGYVWRHSLY